MLLCKFNNLFLTFFLGLSRSVLLKKAQVGDVFEAVSSVLLGDAIIILAVRLCGPGKGTV